MDETNSRKIDIGELTRVLFEDLRAGRGASALTARIRQITSELATEGGKAQDTRDDLVRQRTDEIQAVAVKRRQRVEAFARRRRQIVPDQEGLFIVAGRITDTGTGVGLPNVRVRAIDKDRKKDDPLGTSGTDALGYYRVEFAVADFRDFVEKRPDVFVEVLGADEEVIARSPTCPMPVEKRNVFIALAVDGHKVPANLSVGNKINGFVSRRLHRLERGERVLRPVVGSRPVAAIVARPASPARETPVAPASPEAPEPAPPEEPEPKPPEEPVARREPEPEKPDDEPVRQDRLLLAPGVRGHLVESLQQQLAAQGFPPGKEDGKFGRRTGKAVYALQAARGLASTGQVDEATWRILMGDTLPSLFERCLQLTASFEGHGFTRAVGNFDGAGITWGIIGFTLKHGELKKIVETIHREHPGIVREAFGDKTDEFLEVLQKPLAEQLAWADRITWKSNKRGLAAPWLANFERFGAQAKVRELQLLRADDDFFVPATATAAELGLESELGLALAFDIHVQNGGVHTDARDAIRGQIEESAAQSAEELRVIVANAVADHARPKFRQDVRKRKLTIARGQGKVHRKNYVLRDWGLEDRPYSS